MQVFTCISCGVYAEMDKVFKAPADQTRRYLLDRLYEHNGLTLGELCERLDMTRQSATQHLAVLEAANGWAAVLSNLKSLLETGSPLPQKPWLMPQP